MDEEDLDENNEEKVKSKIQKTTFTLEVNTWFKRFELLAQIYNRGPQSRLGALLSKL